MSWKDLGLQEFWLICNSGMRRSILSLHDICTALGDKLTWCLPALHALTGCDTAVYSSISTKLAALNKSYPQDFVSDPQLEQFRADRSMMQMAETFLVKCFKPTIDLVAFDVLRLAVFNGNAFKMDFERTPFIAVNT